MGKVKMSTIYVPYITQGREKYEFSTIQCGCFFSMTDAINALIDKLIDQNLISFDTFNDIYNDRHYDQDENEENKPSIYNYLPTDEEDFKRYVKEIVGGNKEILIKQCNGQLGDSYYNEGWRVEIYEQKSPIVYTPIIIDNVSPLKHYYCGSFLTKKDAVNALIDKLFKENIIRDREDTKETIKEQVNENENKLIEILKVVKAGGLLFDSNGLLSWTFEIEESPLM
jgi:hypothetical protein